MNLKCGIQISNRRWIRDSISEPQIQFIGLAGKNKNKNNFLLSVTFVVQLQFEIKVSLNFATFRFLSGRLLIAFCREKQKPQPKNFCF